VEQKGTEESKKGDGVEKAFAFKGAADIKDCGFHSLPRRPSSQEP